MEDITGNAVKVGADGDGGVVTDCPEMPGNVRVPVVTIIIIIIIITRCMSQVLPHCTTSIQQGVLQQMETIFDTMTEQLQWQRAP